MPTRPAIVLIAEEQSLVRMEAVHALRSHGYEVLEASNADDALTCLETRAADIRVLFTVIRLAGSLNGLELACLTQRRWPWIKLLIASGNAKPTALPRGSCFISKAYDSEQMVRQVRQLTATA